MPTTKGSPLLEDAAFSEDFCRFLKTTIPSVDAAELLLLLFGEPERRWSAPEAASKLRPAAPITDADAVRYLDLFHARGLIAVDAEKRVRFFPQGQFLRAQVDVLAQAYRERPVTLIRVIYALRDSKVHTFAEAFKIRRS